jgi:hypothetical protein
MAAKSTVWENDILGLLFNATAVANIAINATSSPLTNLYVSLHTSSPGASGNQTTNEAAYGSYARVAVARTSGGWTVTGGSVSPVATIVFPTASSGTETETYVGIGTASSGSGVLLYFGAVSPTIPVVTGTIPQLNTGSVITES